MDQEDYVKQLTPESLRGVYTPFYAGEALRYLLDNGDFGLVDKDVSKDKLIDRLTVSKQGYMLRNTATMLLYIYAHANNLMAYGGTHIHSDAIMMEAFGGVIPAAYYSYRDDNGLLVRIPIEQAVSTGKVSSPLNTYQVLQALYPLTDKDGHVILDKHGHPSGFDPLNFRSYYFQNIISLNRHSETDLADNLALKQIYDTLMREDVRQEMIKEHHLVKEVAHRWQAVTSEVRKEQRHRARLAVKLEKKHDKVDRLVDRFLDKLRGLDLRDDEIAEILEGVVSDLGGDHDHDRQVAPFTKTPVLVIPTIPPQSPPRPGTPPKLSFTAVSPTTPVTIPQITPVLTPSISSPRISPVAAPSPVVFSPPRTQAQIFVPTIQTTQPVMISQPRITPSPVPAPSPIQPQSVMISQPRITPTPVPAPSPIPAQSVMISQPRITPSPVPAPSPIPAQSFVPIIPVTQSPVRMSPMPQIPQLSPTANTAMTTQTFNTLATPPAQFQ